jgi:hypothetical protein
MPSSRRLPSLHQNGTIMLHSEPLPERSIAALTLAEIPLTTCPPGLGPSRPAVPQNMHRGLDLGTEATVHEVPPARARTGSKLDCNQVGKSKTAYRAPSRVC